MYAHLAQAAEVSALTDDSYAPSLTLRLKQSKDIVLTHRALDVADDAARRVVHKLDTDLDHTTARTGAAKNLRNLFVSLYPHVEAFYVRAQA